MTGYDVSRPRLSSCRTTIQIDSPVRWKALLLHMGHHIQDWPESRYQHQIFLVLYELMVVPLWAVLRDPGILLAMIEESSPDFPEYDDKAAAEL